MSRIQELGPKHIQLPSVLAEYEDELDRVEGLIEIKGKRLEQANIENASWQIYYDQKKIELHTLAKFMEMEVARVRGKLFRQYKEGHSMELNEREIHRYVDNEKAYLDMYNLLLEVKDLHAKFESIVNAFTSRGYALNNITKIRVAALEDVEL